MTIHIKALTFDAIIGLLEYERHNTQRISLNIDIEYNYQDKAYIDYAVIVKEVEDMVVDAGYYLLEEAIEAIESYIVHHHKSLLQSLSIEIQKLDIFDNCVVALSKVKKF